MIQLGLLVCVSLVITPASASDAPDQKKNELEWAKGVAVDFLKAVKSNDTRQARQLLTSELAKSYMTDRIEPPFPLSSGFVEGWEFQKERIAPENDEVVLEGVLSGQNSGTEFDSAFTIRVVKIKESGKWRIEFFVFEKCREKQKKK